MQTSKSEKNKNHLLGDEECINFRPSPNFKHMKKYLKSKFEECNSSPNQSSDPSTTPNSEEQETVKQLQSTTNNMAERVQPPLPPNSPPPEFLIVPKQEIEDREYNDKTVAVATTESVVTVKKAPAEIMCRQYARGMCTRGASCIYVHKTILDQLPGVYTFCKNFQNTVCTLPKCKFVHATVFEKEHYYRTGFLPHHTLAHLKESNSALGPPRNVDGAPNDAPPAFPNMQPMQPGGPSMPISGCAPPDGRGKPEMFGPNLSGVKPEIERGRKRDWTEMEMASAAHDQDTNGHLIRKCNTCDVSELRLKRAKAKVEVLVEESEILANQKKQLMEKDARLNNVFDIMLLNSKSHANMLKMEKSESEEQQSRRLTTICRRTTGSDSLSRRLILERKIGSSVKNMGPAQKRMLCRLLEIFKESKEGPPN